MNIKQVDICKIMTIIVTFNPDISFLQRSLNLHLIAGGDAIYIIDNGSRNFQDIESLIYSINKKNIFFINLHKNYGLAHAQNIGIHLAQQAKFDFIVFFDQDSTPSENLVNLLAIEAKRLLALGIKLGALGPVHFDSRTNLEYPLTKFFGPFLFKMWPSIQARKIIEVDILISSGCLIPFNSIEVIGEMRADMFIDCIDIEWCLRAKHMGYKIYAARDIVLSHSIGDKRIKSLGREVSLHTPLRRYYITRNSILLARSSVLPAGPRIWFAISTILTLPRFLFAVRFRRDYVLSTIRGLWHGLCGRVDSL